MKRDKGALRFFVDRGAQMKIMTIQATIEAVF
jgi:hypothetical protein